MKVLEGRPILRSFPPFILAVIVFLFVTADLRAGLSPSLDSQPGNQIVVLGNQAAFHVSASGTGPLSYRWQLNGTNLPDGLITTVAGTGTAGFAGDGGAAGKALLASPHDVVLDSSNNLLIADTANHRIRKMAANGILSTVAGNDTNGFLGDNGPATNASLNSPNGIALDAAGNLFIADSGNHRIRKVDSSGMLSTVAGNGTNGFFGDGGIATNASLNLPSAMCFDAAGNLFIADTQNHRIRRVGLDGNITTVAGNGTWGAYAGDGGPATNATISFPYSVVVDSGGNLLLAEAGGNRVRKVDTNGIITTYAGNGYYSYAGDGGPATNAQLDPFDLTFDGLGNLFIADEYNNRIRKMDTNGIVTTVAGNGSWVYSGDNLAATDATLNFPYGVAVDALGNVFIADTGNHRIREVEVTSRPDLILNGVTANLAGNFQVVISNTFGSITSSVATLTVLLPPAMVAQPVNQYVLLGGSAAFAAAATGDAPLSYLWLRNGAPVSSATNKITVPNVQAGDAGAYQLIVTNAWGAITSSVANLTIATARYVNANNASPSAPYATWATAATVIQNAIDAANVGDWIIVTNGTYATGGRAVRDKKWNRVVMTNLVTVLSVNGPLVTKILGDVAPDRHSYGTRCVWLGSASRLSGFTVTSGGNSFGNYNEGAYDDSGGGIRGESVSGVVENCIITGNTGCWYGGGAYGCTLNNCLVTGNNAYQFTQGGQGGGAYSCTMINCTVAGNTAAIGGGVGWCNAQNCIVYSNTSSPFPEANYLNGTFIHSCTTPDPGGAGNVTNDPVFVDFAGGNFHLQAGSPCIDTGSNAFVTAGSDLDRNPRVVNGTVDMGAYEYAHAPWFQVSPTSQGVLAGSNFSLTVSALGDPTLAYQWWFNGAPLTDGGRITGAGSNSITVAVSQTNDTGSYWATAANGSGTATSGVAQVTVFLPVAITRQPTNVTALISNTATFTVVATGFVAPAYLWYSNGLALANGGRVSGATSAALALANVQTSDNATSYQVVITNTYGAVTSLVATLTVLAPVQITGQPASAAVLLGSNATFAVAASGTGPLGYQWYFNGAPVAEGGRFSGSLTPILNISNVQAGDAGGFSVLVSNVASSVLSRTASLTPQASLAASVRYVALTCTNPLTPYLDWSTAATNIQDAIDAAVPGDLVLVSNGVYKTGSRVVYGTTNRVAVDKAITVQSVNGPGATTINGLYAPTLSSTYGRCVYLTNAAVLMGFTLTNGATGSGDASLSRSGGGVWCESTSSIVSNCVLAGNIAGQFGGGAFRGTLFNCLLTNNTASQGGGACSNILINCALVKNFASFQNLNSGGGAYGCTLSNCLLVANSCFGGGGGAFLSTLTSCVLSSNSGNYGAAVCYGTVNNCLISSNRSFNYGGGAFSNVLINCVLKNNSAGRIGGGAYYCNVTNCTVVSNTAPLGGGVNGGVVDSSIVYDNPGGNLGDTKAVYYTCFIPAFGPGNFTNAPQFVNEAAGDFHLQSNSPCINSGNSACGAGPNDFDGNPRVQGGTVDAGAFEFQSPLSTLSYAYLQQYGLPTDSSADLLDSDGDGLSNWQEWHAGTNPTNAASLLRMTAASATNAVSGVVVSWQSVNGMSYLLQRGVDLSQQPPFATIQSNILGKTGVTTYKDTTATNGGAYYYRVGVQ